jgi:hypothetical protein
MNPDIVIMTTAIDRPELHNVAFESYKQYISNANAHWVITVNNTKDNIQLTVDNINYLLSDYKVHIKTFNTGGSKKDWFESVKYCINYAFDLRPNIGYFFLEDDWMYTGTGSLNSDFLLAQNLNSHISLANRTEVSFNPAIWGLDSFNTLMHYSINNVDMSLGRKYSAGDNTNPERICCPHPESTNFVRDIKTLNRFKDMGREWQRKYINTRTFNIK